MERNGAASGVYLAAGEAGDMVLNLLRASGCLTSWALPLARRSGQNSPYHGTMTAEVGSGINNQILERETNARSLDIAACVE